MARETFDVCVVGAGINGAAIARDASMRGLSVALVDAGDFAGATSSASSKLIHGGFRYLPQYQFRLVYSALRERELLRHRTAPHLVRPIRFLFPTYRGRGFGHFTMSAGLFLYDLFARTPAGERHRSLDAAGVIEIEPALARQGLTGGALYCDAWADDARVTLENALDAGIHGAAVANYARVEGFVGQEKGRAIALRNVLTDRTFELRARVVVNAAGPWVDHVRRMDDSGARPSVRLTKGVHLVFPLRKLPVHQALVLSDSEQRIVFVMPHDSYVLVGTTDTVYSDDPEGVAVNSADIKYLLGVLHASLPSLRIGAEDIASSFAGLRALEVNNRGVSPSSVSREEVILESAPGMITVAGGKLTTHREIADRIVGRIGRGLNRNVGRCPTVETPLPGARALNDPRAADALASLDVDVRDLLRSRYGTRASIVAKLAIEDPDLARPLGDGCPAIGAEVVHAVRNEMAHSLADFLVRRTSLTWRYPLEAATAGPAAARIMGEQLGWTREREESECAAFAADLKRRRAA